MEGPRKMLLISGIYIAERDVFNNGVTGYDICPKNENSEKDNCFTVRGLL